ncbi:MAG: YrhK family protein [Gammaproteobacteria bacterium]|nr:YrhK family protein [Gammaproteobacteria bacterium]
MKTEDENEHTVTVELGQEHLTITHRYEALGALNDLFIAVWFLIGSFMFLNKTLVDSGTWLFIIGSAQLMCKPTIKLIGLIHVRRVISRGRR